MEALTDWLIAFITSEDNLGGLAMIAAAAGLEYIVPPFPGDTITILGAVLVTGYGWSFAAVFAAVMLGSVLGSMAAFALGRRLEDRAEHAVTIGRLVARFRRHGGVYLILNRFVPGIRALFFVAAGMAGMRTSSVLIYSAISAALWHLMLMTLGMALGANLEAMQLWVTRYTAVAAAIMTAFLVALGLYSWRRRRRAH